jgi:predicted transcriptional regulator
MPDTNDGGGDGLDGGRNEESDPARVQTALKAAQALSEAGFGDVCVLTHEEVNQVLTPTAREILRTLADTHVESVRDLAQQLDRNQEVVAQNVETLAADGLIEYENEGQAKHPMLCHDTYILEPLVADVDVVSGCR